MQGISVYQKASRPTFYVAYDCPLRARRVCESSGISIDDPRGRLAAYSYAREKSMSGVTHGQARDISGWENWVEPWLRMRFANKAKTLTSYLGAWKFLSFFLSEHRIANPRSLTYQNAVDFVLWRESQVKRQSGRKVSRNTALHNIKVLSRIMREAVRRDYAKGNPCFRLSEDVPPTPPPEKPELRDEDILKIRRELTRRHGLGRPSDWMQTAFEIAIHQGCRLSATQIPMERIDFKNNTIRFHEKGGQVFTVPMHPDLRPHLLKLKAAKREVTCVLPRFASRNFGRVMRDIGLPHTFHCSRVTVITRFARAGVSQQRAMAYVHHGSWAVHKIYQRLMPADVADCHAALDFSSSAITLGSPQNRDAPRSMPTPSRASKSGPRKSGTHSPAEQAAG